MCSIFVIKLQCQKIAAFAAKYQLKRVTVAILNCASFQFCCLMNRNVNYFTQTVGFYRNNKMFCGIKSYSTCSNAVFRH